jgi:uncharacterized protein with HEPN domain
MSRDEAALLDILRAARMVVEFKGTADKETFIRDLKTQSAVLHQLILLGEAVKRLSEEFRVRNPHIPWRAIAGIRDKVIHEYDAVDLDEVWRTVSVDIPRLITLVEPLVPRETEG